MAVAVAVGGGFSVIRILLLLFYLSWCPLKSASESSGDTDDLSILIKQENEALLDSCQNVVCVSKTGTEKSRLFRAVYKGDSSVLVFFRFEGEEDNVELSSIFPIQRAQNGDAYLSFQMDISDNIVTFLRADIIFEEGWSIPRYSWSYANLIGTLCLDNGDACLEEIVSSDKRVRTIMAVNYKYIEESINFKVTGSSNANFKLWDNSPFKGEAIAVIPRRLPKGYPIKVQYITAYQVNPENGWWFSFEFFGRRGDYRIESDGYLYDPPFVGTFQLNQGYSGLFSHTGWEEYSVDWDLPVSTEVYSARDGVVCYVKEDQLYSKFDAGICPEPVTENCNTPGSDGNTIIVRHDDGTWGLYTHLDFKGSLVKEGDVIKGKTMIGYSGNTGYSLGPHLHFQVTKTSAFDHPKHWIAETIKVQFINNHGEAFTPVTGKSYTATVSYQQQPFPVYQNPKLYPTPPLVVESFKESAFNHQSELYSNAPVPLRAPCLFVGSLFWLFLVFLL